MQSSIRVLLAIAVLGSTLCLGQAQAQTTPQYVYSVKFLCGLQVLGPRVFIPPQEPPVKPGNYATAVNIHNFHNADAVFAKKAVVALPERQTQRGPVSNFVKEVLGPDQALEVDCTDIVSLFAPPVALPPFIKGFVEIVSPVQLSVTAVYTAQTCKNPKTQKVSTQIGNCSQLGELALEVVPQNPFVVQ
jgi:hypothetical protein